MPGPDPGLGRSPPGNLHLKIFLPGAKQVVKEHDYVTMRCLDATRIPVARYFWTHGDKWLQERGQNLHISDTSTAHGGVYTCSIWVSGPGWAFLVSSGNKSITVHCECWEPLSPARGPILPCPHRSRLMATPELLAVNPEFSECCWDIT